MLTASQSCAARSLLGLSASQLASWADVPPASIVMLEAGIQIAPAHASAIRSFIEATGIEFIDTSSGAALVRLRGAA